jgi:hypothetical protein
MSSSLKFDASLSTNPSSLSQMMPWHYHQHRRHWTLDQSIANTVGDNINSINATNDANILTPTDDKPTHLQTNKQIVSKKFHDIAPEDLDQYLYTQLNLPCGGESIATRFIRFTCNNFSTCQHSPWYPSLWSPVWLWCTLLVRLLPKTLQCISILKTDHIVYFAVS